jgi:hypothetical protein
MFILSIKKLNKNQITILFMIQRISIFSLILFLVGCAPRKAVDNEKIFIRTLPENATLQLEVEFIRGKAFNHPSFAIWTEDMEGNYIETLYVTAYVAKGRFAYGELAPGKWQNEPGEARRPATLPYWAHKRNIEAPDGLYIPSTETAVPDALSSATPRGSFNLETATSHPGKGKFRVLLEINQAWDSNEFWTNNKFPGDINYLSSFQPALVYAVTVDPDKKNTEYYLNPIGHSHYAGTDGELYTDLTTLTTARDIAQKIIVRLR